MPLIKLSAFNIQNFRSIINSGWRTLANDNITVLIGQNESGKTSVLEALQSFYENLLNEDVLRSDNTLPVISCSFKIENNDSVASLVDNSKLSPELSEILKSESDFTLTRSWNNNRTSILYITSPKVSEYFEKIESQERSISEITEAEIDKILSHSDSLFKNLEIAELDKNEAQLALINSRKVLEDKERLLRKAKKPDAKLIAENELQFAQTQYGLQEKNYSEKAAVFENLKSKTQELSEKISIGNSYRQIQNRYSETLAKIKESQHSIAGQEHIYELNTNDKEKRNIYAALLLYRSELDRAYNSLQQLEIELKRTLLIASKVLIEGVHFRQAETDVSYDLSMQTKYLTKYEIGEGLFKYIPAFEFFEDFSGLLPNKIDLEDILNNNHQVEGYKAAVNFLKIAGLDSSFFREKNHRILKQRIEMLNSDVTINFQDYWSQQIGKDNKIKLHFELEHYDYTVPEKSGKPYLEFWIKDKQERLYPKQRSRGVRWFLSFYLELKATAINPEVNRVLLIDEPGLSLHARAQEDVLKVFEDLKQSMQIIYCTHSPHLVKTEKLYRVLAVQRADEDDDKSESKIFEPSMLSGASSDTLTPIYSMMGIKLADQQFIQAKHNIIVPDGTAYYYLHWISKILPGTPEINFIPATSPETILLLINLLSAWQVRFGIILFGKGNESVINEINNISIFQNDNHNKIKHFESIDLPEDMFSTIDFKKYILQERTGITEKNSEFICNNGLSRKILATNFVNYLNQDKLSFSEFDETTKHIIEEVFTEIKKLL